MPSLNKPAKLNKVLLPSREAVEGGEADVLVIGGGPAGIGAALGAARAGAKVILAERYGFFGGNATAALVMPLMSFHTQSRAPLPEVPARLLPSDQGVGRSVLAGVVSEFLNRLVAEGGGLRPSEHTGYVVPFDPEIFKMTALEMLDEAGVRFFFHAFASGVLGDSRVEGVVFETKSGPIVLRARAFIDASGDGDIAAMAGAPFEVGRESDGLVQPMTLMFRMVEFERAAFRAYIKKHPGQWRGVYGLWDLVRQASEKGELDLPREDVLMFSTPHEKEVSVNSTRVTRVLGTDAWDWSYAEWQSRMQMKQVSTFLRHYVPGFKDAYVAQSGVHTGVRETRRVTGEYQLTEQDILNARKFEDVIARSTYPVDIHNPAGKGTILKRLPPGESYDIPLRALIPQGVENLLVSGRCISGTHQAMSSYRVMPTAMATGQAAGVCAALAAKENLSSHAVPFQSVQTELRLQGADLGDHVKA